MPSLLSAVRIHASCKYLPMRENLPGPLWLASMTSFDPDVRVCRQVSLAVEPACTLMTVLVFWTAPLGPPLQAMSLEVTSWMGCIRFRKRNYCKVVPGGRTPSYETTRTPSPTAPLFSDTKIVCAEAVEAAAANTMGVENFMTRIESRGSAGVYCSCFGRTRPFILSHHRFILRLFHEFRSRMRHPCTPHCHPAHGQDLPIPVIGAFARYPPTRKATRITP